MKKRGELVKRSFAYCYDTGGMRRTHLRKHNNIIKRQLIHIAGFNLSLIFRRLLGAGTPREWNNLGGMLFCSCLGCLYAARNAIGLAEAHARASYCFLHKTGNSVLLEAVPEIRYLLLGLLKDTENLLRLLQALSCPVVSCRLRGSLLVVTAVQNSRTGLGMGGAG